MAIVKRTLDVNNLKGLSEETKRRLGAMTEDEIEANALSERNRLQREGSSTPK